MTSCAKLFLEGKMNFLIKVNMLFLMLSSKQPRLPKLFYVIVAAEVIIRMEFKRNQKMI